jgi:hypothetical protein
LKTSIIVSLLLIICFVVAGCNKSESRFEGKWVGKTGSFDFYKNRTGVINPPEGIALPRNVQFKWSVQGSDTVRIDVGAPVGKSFYGKLVTDSALIIEDDRFVKQK